MDFIEQHEKIDPTFTILLSRGECSKRNFHNVESIVTKLSSIITIGT